MNQKEFARELRENQTDAESLMWRMLRNRQLENFKFRRQPPTGRYIVDFCCVEKKLIIELDGGQHVENSVADSKRTGELEKGGYKVLRFWNNDVLMNADGVLEIIRTELLK